MSEQVVDLAPGESRVISFEAIPREAKTHRVSVDGLTESFTCIGLTYRLGIGIYNETVPKYIAGTLIIDGAHHSVAVNRYLTIFLAGGTHTLDLTVPSGYNFLRWDIYDWDTLGLILQENERFFSLDLVKNIFMRAIVKRELTIEFSNPSLGDAQIYTDSGWWGTNYLADITFKFGMDVPSTLGVNEITLDMVIVMDNGAKKSMRAGVQMAPAQYSFWEMREGHNEYSIVPTFKFGKTRPTSGEHTYTIELTAIAGGEVIGYGKFTGTCNLYY